MSIFKYIKSINQCIQNSFLLFTFPPWISFALVKVMVFFQRLLKTFQKYLLSVLLPHLPPNPVGNQIDAIFSLCSFLVQI